MNSIEEFEPNKLPAATEDLEPEYQNLLKACKQFLLIQRQTYEQLIRQKWELGKLLLRYEENGFLQRYGENTMRKLAGDLNQHYSNLYRCVQFAEIFPTEQFLDDLITGARGGPELTWDYIRSHILPVASRGYTQNELIDHTFNKVEQLARQVEELSETIVSPEREEEKRGVIEKAREIIKETKEKASIVEQDQVEWRERKLYANGIAISCQLQHSIDGQIWCPVDQGMIGKYIRLFYKIEGNQSNFEIKAITPAYTIDDYTQQGGI